VFEDHRGVVGTTGPVADRQQSLAELLDREILPCLERPGRLLGPFDLPSATVTGTTEVALVWPSIAEGAHAPAALRPHFVGLPNPRVFSLTLGSVPSPNLRAALRQRGLPAFGRPDWVPLIEVDLWIVWLTSPLQLTGLLTLLDSCALEIRAAARGARPRIVVAGPAVERVRNLARVYADAVWVRTSSLDEQAWLALGEAARIDGDWTAPLRPLGDIHGPLEADHPVRQEAEPQEEQRVAERRDFNARPDLAVTREFLDRGPWKEPGRAEAFTDHIVIGAGSARLRGRHGLPPTADLLDRIERSLGAETASLALHFVLGLPGETEADRLAIADFIDFVVTAAPRGPRQVSVRLHALVGESVRPVGAAEFNAERAGRVNRIIQRTSIRRLRVDAAPPELAEIESLLGLGPQSSGPLEFVWGVGGRVAEDESATSWAAWHRSLGGSLDEAGDDAPSGGTKPAPTGLPSRLRVVAPASVSPSASRTRLPKSRRTRSGRWTRWQALVPSHFDYRIEFAKQGRLRFLGPNELSDLLLGACERAGIPICTTGVVQPRPRVGFGPALPAGIAGDCEYIDISLERKAEDLESQLRNELPEEIQVRAVVFMPRCTSSMQLSRIAQAEYEAVLEPGCHAEPASRLEDEARVRQWKHRIEEGLPPEAGAEGDPIAQLRRIHWRNDAEGAARLEFTLDLRTSGARCKPRDVIARALPQLSVDPRLIPMRRRRLFVEDDDAGRTRLCTPLEQARRAQRRQRVLERMCAE
jgi:radical SAM-linked protein